MRFETGQYQTQSMQQKLTPRMIQAMQILQLPSLALEERIEQEMINNPTLELADPDVDLDELSAQQAQETRDANEGERELSVQDDSVDSDHADDFERLSNMSEEYGDSWSNNYESEAYRPARDTGERDAKLDAMANTAARPASLTDQLLDQWRLVETTDIIRRAGECLIDLIDKDGYLRADQKTIDEQCPEDVTEQDLQEALERIQKTMEPVGIGARDLRECLLLQIDARLRVLDSANDNHGDFVQYNGDPIRNDLRLARELVADHLKDVEANRLPKVAAAVGCEMDAIKSAITQLSQLYLHPGRVLAPDDREIIRPDAVIEFDEINDRYVAALVSGRFPALQISPDYRQIAQDKSADKKTRDYVKGHMQSARWLLDAIEQRESTVLRVINVVISAQREFLDHGHQYLRPLPMTQVADTLGIHVATVSRAVSEKYIQTPRGIFALRMFFSGGTETDAGEAMSWTAVQAKLKEIVDEEDKSKPFNDDQLVEKLKEKGIEIARRTVAKYRKELNIPAARQRRQY